MRDSDDDGGCGVRRLVAGDSASRSKPRQGAGPTRDHGTMIFDNHVPASDVADGLA